MLTTSFLTILWSKMPSHQRMRELLESPELAFGKAEWFRPGRAVRGLHPAGWQGWLYYLTWCAIALLPAMILMTRGQLPETAVWLLGAGAMLTLDLYKLRRTRTRLSAAGGVSDHV